MATTRRRVEWKCDECGTSGGSDYTPSDGAWDTVQIILALHGSVSPKCLGGRDTIRIMSDTPLKVGRIARKVRR